MKYLCFLITYLSISWAAQSLEANTRDHRRIIGGDYADIKKFPYMGGLLARGQFGGGAVLIRYDSALISYDTVLTAAHCVQHLNITDLSVRFGSSRWRSGGEEIPVKQVTIHEEYYPWYHPDFISDYDIAVLKLKRSVNVANAAPIPLAKPGREYSPGTLGVMSGWGETCLGAGGSTETLRKVEVLVYNQTQCREAHEYDGFKLSNRMICTGYKDGGKGVYRGDSGGPYVINGELVGIASFVDEGCAKPGIPDVYVFVPAFNDWLIKILYNM